MEGAMGGGYVRMDVDWYNAFCNGRILQVLLVLDEAARSSERVWLMNATREAIPWRNIDWHVVSVKWLTEWIDYRR